MEFTNSFTVNSPLEQVWTFMINAEEVTPCVPGAEITETIDGTHYKGRVKIKLGAVQMTYRGELEMQPDEASRIIVIKAKGTEMRGSGGASGTVTTTLTEEGGATKVDIHSHVDVTGRVAQFGRGIMQDVSNRLIRDFAQCLERKLTEGAVSSADSTQSSSTGAGGEPQDAGGSATASTPQPADAGSVLGASPESDMPAVSPPPDGGTPSPAPATITRPSASNPPVSTATTSNEPAELRLGPILLDLVRSRTAAGLRVIASLIEPK